MGYLDVPVEKIPHLRGAILRNEMLADYTTWKVGGPADLVYTPADMEDLTLFLHHIPKEIPIYWLGMGSNVLIRDGGLEGIVIITQGAVAEISRLEPHVIRAEAGVSCAQLAKFAALLGLTGLEFMAAIPGTVGGALATNASCFGGETWESVRCVEVINHVGEKNVRANTDYRVGYRSVHLSNDVKEWFAAGYFELPNGDKEQSLENIRNLIEKRNATQPADIPGCGSVFKNPEGLYAGQLIEQCGLKGYVYGRARVSDKHANFIINEGHASATEVETLIQQIAENVEKQYGITLTPDVRIIGKP